MYSCSRDFIAYYCVCIPVRIVVVFFCMGNNITYTVTKTLFLYLVVLVPMELITDTKQKMKKSFTCDLH